MGKRFYVFLCLFLVCAGSGAMERRYLAPMEQSNWQMTITSPLLCEMEHEIPRFGKAIFSRAAGRGLRLKLTSHQRLKAGLAVQFLSESPGWKSIQTQVDMASLTTQDDSVLLNVGTGAAQYAYLELQDGYHSGFYFDTDKQQVEQTVVMISTVRFRDVEASFEQCIGNLYFENFDDVRVSRIHFDHDDEFPRLAEEDAVFQRIYDYLKVDPAVSEIVVSGHADFSGTVCYNDSLSLRRAMYVYDYLVSMGIDARKIRLDYFGELKPLVKGKSQSALAANRRVTVELRH